ncbi:hypothetical protein COL72_27600 [Bacillus toyonensis]|uniref:endonuclease n=1 Tax=Bacillus toyonensis TaxID=155322 RepID=UPI000BF37A55|nr:endonuclease [Bacillus toyonensis]PFZ68065.1 hypothetical protein COL72_27600 [Bacillus toyonensis]
MQVVWEAGVDSVNRNTMNIEHIVPQSWFSQRNQPNNLKEPMRADGGTFEPEYGKGFVARATLYFLLRYPDKIEAEFRPIVDIELLLNWHKQFPPTSVYEKHRNPLIDYPEFAERIDFQRFRQLH